MVINGFFLVGGLNFYLHHLPETNSEFTSGEWAFCPKNKGSCSNHGFFRGELLVLQSVEVLLLLMAEIVPALGFEMEKTPLRCMGNSENYETSKVHAQPHPTDARQNHIYLEPKCPRFAWKRPAGLLLRVWPSKIEVIGALGIYMVHANSVEMTPVGFRPKNPLTTFCGFQVLQKEDFQSKTLLLNLGLKDPMDDPVICNQSSKSIKNWMGPYQWTPK